MRRRLVFLLLVLLGLLVLLFLGHLGFGPVSIPLADVIDALFGNRSATITRAIVLDVRLPEALTALVAGMGLAACGLIMQTLFRNPLAGPSVLGLSSGSSLGVAICLLVQPAWVAQWFPVELSMVVGAFAGSMSVLLLILLADGRLGDGVALLIVGLMLGHLCGAAVDVLQAAAGANALKGFVLWGMGSFGGVVLDRSPWLIIPVLAALLVAHVLVKPLNALLLGDQYAHSLGVPVSRVRQWAIWTTGVLVATITAFCGPIAFLGLATPHVARGLCRTSDHRILMPVTVLCGAVLALFCGLVVKLPLAGGAIPLNAVTSLLGAPVVAWVLLSGKRWARSS